MKRVAAPAGARAPRANLPPPHAPAAPHPSTALSHALAAAARRLAAVLEGASLGAATADVPTPEAQRAQVHELLYGTLRRYGEGDAILALLADRPLETPLRALLLVALYRLRSSPETAHTTVNQAVEAAAFCGQGRAGGLVNAVLRNALRQQVRIDAHLLADPVASSAHPMWWLQRLKRAYPGQWPGMIEADNRQPPITLRVNQRRQSVDGCLAALQGAGVLAERVAGYVVDRVVDAPLAIRLTSPGRIDRLPGFAEGHFSVQDPGAQRAATLLDVAPGQRVLDACAAPGGKTSHLLESADLAVTALDIDPARCRRIEENLDRLGLRAEVLTGDAAQPAAWWDGQPYQRILADVPCTASGIVRRHPDAKWLRREKDISGFSEQQKAILHALWPLLAVGGKLLYATCSIFPEENNVQISDFCAAWPQARLVHHEQWQQNEVHDGFFYAVLEKASV